MQCIARMDARVAMRLVRDSYRATIESGDIDEIGDVIDMLEAVVRPGPHGLSVIADLFDVGLLSFLRDCIASPTFDLLVMQSEEAGNVSRLLPTRC